MNSNKQNLINQANYHQQYYRGGHPLPAHLLPQVTFQHYRKLGGTGPIKKD